MLTVYNETFVLHTKNTTYAMRVMPTGQLEHLYYGARILWNEEAAKALGCKDGNPDGTSIAYDRLHPNLGLDHRSLEVSGCGKGDYRQPFIDITYADGNRTTDYVYESYEILEGIYRPEGMPGCHAGNEEEPKTLHITMKDRNYEVLLHLYYTALENCDCMVRSARLENISEEPLVIHRLMSTQLDLLEDDYVMTSFHGDWTDEMNRTDTPVAGVSVVSASSTGNSSNHANPFVMITRPDMGETHGEGYACNLLYSGNHYEAAQGTSHEELRMVAGVNPEGFAWKLSAKESFSTPQAVMTYSGEGYREISSHMHQLVREHVVQGEWQHKLRPILLNSWEACYFKINESKLLSLAKKARSVGVELFVMDDGWFGHREDDTSSLGDWVVNEKKFPKGLRHLGDQIRALGMEFGIWVEPEMISEDSDLYQAHPDWAIKAPRGTHSEGRHQMILDLTRNEVRDYLVERMSEIFMQSGVTYVKWDMNRNFSDCYSSCLEADRQGEVLHRYILGLYEVMERLTKAFPQILFEGCASGGNRFDLGILSYFPQIWASDNTDAICRMKMQHNYSYGYPQSVISAHVSGVPNHQTLRRTPLHTRYQVAAFGVLGYECNLNDLDKEELEEIRNQICLYKENREVMQYGQWLRCPSKGMDVSWSVISKDCQKAVAMFVQTLVRPNHSVHVLRVPGLEAEATYHICNRKRKLEIELFGDLVNTMTPVHVKPDGMLHHVLGHFVKLEGEAEDYRVSGSLLSKAGLRLSQSYTGAGLEKNTRVMTDYDSRMYYLERL